MTHLDLHSFPTRRSSDLNRKAAAKTPPLTCACGCHRSLYSQRSLMFAPPRLQPPVATAAAQRSEEHTSELQSRGHLVCRLLLEKKNAKDIAEFCIRFSTF